MPTGTFKLLFALFALSAYRLIYESVFALLNYSRGAAFAQSFVLARFHGGMRGGGSRAAGRRAIEEPARRLRLIEAAIGVAALDIHESFVLLTQISLDHVIPALGSPSTVEITSTRVRRAIVPQTVLLA